MHKLSVIVIFLIITMNCLADGWRSGEQQVIIVIKSSEQVQTLNNLKINFEAFSNKEVRAYLVPREKSYLESLGFQIKTEIEDLNKHFESFWIAEDAYHSYQQIIDLADSLEEHFPSICKKYLFGTSLGGRQLAALKISDNVLTDEPEAEVFFDGGIHGDEIGGAENIIRFAREFCLSYGSNSTITNLINNREIWLYLMVNPDGRVNMVRYNNNGVDLNRDCGYMWNGEGSSSGPFNEIESKALRLCNLENQFVVYTSYHSGTEFVSYPWSYRPDATYDNAHINQLAQVYVNASGYTALPYGQGYAGMYPINGSSKDAYYGITGSVSWSIEISTSKQPPASQIMTYYNYNKPSMIALVEYSGYGLQGTVADAQTGEPVAALVFVNNYYPCYTDPEVGDYHKYVLPGTYTITVKANGYITQTISGITVSASNVTTTNFQLISSNERYAYKFIASYIPGNNFADEGNTPAALCAPDNINYSIGKSGYCILDMQSPVLDGAGSDFRVYEGDASPEGYTCYAGSTMDGPWISLGTGSGTTEFDLAISGLTSSRYIKILDDGDGTASEANAGFDLDAVKILEPVSGVYIAMTGYEVDDSFGNNNGKIDPGETVDIIVTLKNNGNVNAQNVTGVINTVSPYLTIQAGTTGFGDIGPGQSSSGTYTVTADAGTPAGEPVTIDLNVTANSGAYSNNFVMNFVIGQIPLLIIDLDGNHNSGTVIKTSIEANGVAADYTTVFPTTLNIYSSVFLCLGIYSSNHVLTTTEGQALAAFLNGGGTLYMEGGDTWAYDTQTAVHSMFKISGVSDGSADMSTIAGKTGTFTQGMSFVYSGDNSWMDRINPISPAILILQNQSPVYGTGVAYNGGTYKTIGCSHEFGGLVNGVLPSTRTELMHQYLDFFELLPPPTTTLNLKAVLEGPFTGSQMSNSLSPLMPLSQPYNTLPWSYSGSESVAAIPANVVDWVLIELRDATTPANATPATRIARQAGFIKADGNIVSTNGTSPLVLPVTAANGLFIVIHHRNHLSILSATALSISGGIYTYDFTTGYDKTYGGANGCKEVWPGYWGMIGGDANSDGNIDESDISILWRPNAGEAGYRYEDLNLDGQVDNRDKDDCWQPNNGSGSQVPE